MESNSIEVLALECPQETESDNYNLRPLPDGSHLSEEMTEETPICPRIGEEFQVETPDIPLQPIPVPADHPFLIGLPIPLTWAPQNTGTLPAVPAVPAWNEKDKQGFLLGLYIFGKNLKLVRQFMENKGMGEVLAYYYGVFYKSEQYKRWAECRKVRTRRCILGTRIFTGWRQQEIVSRLQAGVLQDVHQCLLEFIKSFNENTTTFEEFIFSLKEKIGIQAFIDTIGIGKGRYDLTGTGPDSTRALHPIPTRPEIPVGKACSTLSSNEIIKYLTGDFRLSKARSNDLFWEAVWPRLLARGWHSEQPRDLIGSKNSLVFLIPGIKKFSRKKLTKGDHYYDCVSDVLKKVASDPGLIEIDGVVDNGSRPVNTKEYFRSRGGNFGAGLVQFMVVDTSLLSEGGRVRVRELRNLPSDTGFRFEPGSNMVGPGLTDILSDTSDSEVEKVEKARVKRKNLVQSGTRQMEGPVIGTVTGLCAANEVNDHVETASNVNNQEGHFGNFGESSKPKSHKYLSPVTKRRRLNACKHDRKNVSLFKGNNSEAVTHNGSVLSSPPVREMDHPTRKRKVKFLVKDVMEEGEAFDASLYETGQMGQDETQIEPAPSEKRKRKFNFLVREPLKISEENELKPGSSERNEIIISESTKTEPISKTGSPDKELEPVRDEGSTNRRRKVTFLVREAMQVEKEGIADSVNEPKMGLNTTQFDLGPPAREKKVAKRKPKSKSLTKDVKKQGNEEPQHFHLSIPKTAPAETSTGSQSCVLVPHKTSSKTEETKEPQQLTLTLPKVGSTGTTEAREAEPTEMSIIKEEPQPSDSGTGNKPSVPVPVPEPVPVQNETGMTGRRVGTRNRPPTARALEAVASGLLGGPKQRNSPCPSRRVRKSGEPSRRSRKKDETVALAPSDDMVGSS